MTTVTNQPAVQMILECLKVIEQDPLNTKGQPTKEELFLQFLDWAAVNLSYEVYVSTPGYQIETHDLLKQIFQVDLLFAVGEWDWIGEAAVAYGVIPALEDQNTLAMMAKVYAEANKQQLESGRELVVLDPNVGTGRMILSYYRQVSEDLMFFAAAQDLLQYRIALLNMHLYGVKAFVLFADPTIHDLDIDSKNWLAAGEWKPLKEQDMYERKLQQII